ncbi:mechanosensitive ion channel family protein [Luteibaculum oceani]|uniref:mechanosensitive ion channel family protein n=1 Tax=Luteibaculum oceani TaxID=1294296 RepID=UPI0014773B49|nr:mechanosensitive ion channel domain-containing protein [Luteibaculum oceani]
MKEPILVQSDTLFFISYSDSLIQLKDRALSINSKVDSLQRTEGFNPIKILISQSDSLTELKYVNYSFAVLYPDDTLGNHVSIDEMAMHLKSSMSPIANPSAQVNMDDLYETLKQFGIIVLIIILSYLIFRGVNLVYKWLEAKLRTDKLINLRPLHYKDVEVLNQERLFQLVSFFLKALRILVVIILVYLLIPTVFSFFPDTQEMAYKLFGYIFNPLNDFIKGFFNYFPELILIVLVIIGAKYLIRFLAFWRKEIEGERLVLKGFYAEWAKPTFNLLRFTIYLITIVFIIQHLPGSNTPIFLGVLSVLGLTLALSASKPLSNFVSGILITYMRAFRVGDRIRVDESSGVVVDKNLFITRIKTRSNEYITLPNSKMMDAHVINYSASEKELGLVVYCEFWLDARFHFRDIEKEIVEAALKAESIVDNPKPILLITEMDNGRVKYKISAYTQNAGKLERIKSSLYRQVQNTLEKLNIQY